MYQTLKNKHVQNLYWLIASPSPIDENYFSGLNIFPEKWQNKIVLQHYDFFLALDENPEPLIQHVKSKKTNRLGIYAELLMSFFFIHSPHIKSLHQNLQIFDDKKTIGEIDFIIEWESKVIHIELTVKYYLAFNNINDTISWIGPSSKDRLSYKIDKLEHFQLPLIQSPQFKKETNLKPQSFSFFKGYFFTKNEFSPSWKNKKAKFGSYLYENEIHELNENTKYTQLVRPNWMADLIISRGENVIEINSNFLDELQLPILIKNIESKELTFIVPKKWPSLI